METQATTKSGKLNRIIAHAEKLGLLVTVDVEEPMQYQIEVISVRIRRDFTNTDRNMLSAVYATEFINILALRSCYATTAKAFRLDIREYNDWATTSKILPSKIHYVLERMAADIVRYYEDGDRYIHSEHTTN